MKQNTNILARFKQWILSISSKNKEPKLLKKGYEVICPCGKIYTENYEPSKRYIPCCNDCLPF